jgi:hypothetical protein
MRTKIAVMVGLLCFAGCVTPTEGDRQLFDQNRQAGDVIAANDALPSDVRATGEVVSQNSVTLMENLGAPDDPRPYSVATSADLRAKAQREHRETPGFLTVIAQAVTPWAPWAAPLIPLAWGLVQSLGRRKAVAKLAAVYDGVDAVKKEVGEGKYADAVTDVMREVAGLHNVYSDVKADLKEFRS